MANPTTTGAIVAPIPFQDRVKLVHEEIQRRKSEANPANPTHFVARLWVSWLNRNVLNAEVAL
ncbi:hypothetical protein [Thiothrix winogradskyi]|uniref:Uncharacterized protein n=1 Tax=Thiothrix winogradskyi TaxID=96472 RepID=A0ABY3T6Q5_9GAMM|nr:hypothetical protein [Thiothrix winogradskyi]UJS26048.1 hypothetical protein L2Y54_08415 [Thiothrix winogradskyi]